MTEFTPEQIFERCANKWPQKDCVAWEMLINNPFASLRFAQEVIKGPFPDGEPAIATTPETALNYALLTEKPFPLGEPSIAAQPLTAFDYAKSILTGRFVLGEESMATKADIAYGYARELLHAPFVLGEDVIATSPGYSSLYASDVLKGPFVKGEAQIAKDPRYAIQYATTVLDAPFPLGESLVYHSTHAKTYSFMLSLWKKEGHAVDPFRHLAFYLQAGTPTDATTKRHAKATKLPVEWIKLAHSMWSPGTALDDAVAFLKGMKLAPSTISEQDISPGMF